MYSLSTYLISKVLDKISKASRDTLVNFSSIKFNAFSCLSPHVKATFVLITLVKTAIKLLKSFKNLL